MEAARAAAAAGPALARGDCAPGRGGPADRHAGAAGRARGELAAAGLQCAVQSAQSATLDGPFTGWCAQQKKERGKGRITIARTLGSARSHAHSLACSLARSLAGSLAAQPSVRRARCASSPARRSREATRRDSRAQQWPISLRAKSRERHFAVHTCSAARSLRPLPLRWNARQDGGGGGGHAAPAPAAGPSRASPSLRGGQPRLRRLAQRACAGRQRRHGKAAPQKSDRRRGRAPPSCWSRCVSVRKGGSSDDGAVLLAGGKAGRAAFAGPRGGRAGGRRSSPA